MWAKKLAQSIGVVKQTNADIIRPLERDSEELAGLQDSFLSLIRSQARNRNQRSIEISCFYEELPLPGIGTVSFICIPECHCILTDL